MSNYTIYQIHPADKIANLALEAVYYSTGNNFRKPINTFWYSRRTRFDGDAIMLLAISNTGSFAGVSCAAILKERKLAFNSMICVVNEYRRMGIGNELMAATVSVFDARYPEATYRCSFNRKNSAAIKICQRNNLELYDEGKTESGVEFVEYRKLRYN